MPVYYETMAWERCKRKKTNNMYLAHFQASMPIKPLPSGNIHLSETAGVSVALFCGHARPEAAKNLSEPAVGSLVALKAFANSYVRPWHLLQ